MSTRIGYVWKDAALGAYGAQQKNLTGDIQSAEVLPITGLGGFIPVRVTEEPGPPIREVVELKGTVDLDGLKFAIRRNGAFWDQSFGWVYDLAAASLWATHDATVDSVRRLQILGSVVGIREVPGPTVRKVEEITE